MRVFFLAFLISGPVCLGQTAEEVFQKSKDADKPVLLIFSGSDWCAPCIRFQKKVLGTHLFEAYVDDHFIMLKADFPQRTTLPENMRQRNEDLAEQFNPQGQFPRILLVRHDRTIIKVFDFINQSPEEFIAELGPYQ